MSTFSDMHKQLKGNTTKQKKQEEKQAEKKSFYEMHSDFQNSVESRRNDINSGLSKLKDFRASVSKYQYDVDAYKKDIYKNAKSGTRDSYIDFNDREYNIQSQLPELYDFVRKNRNYFGADYNSTIKFLDSVRDGTNFSKSIDSLAEYAKGFKTEEEYNAALEEAAASQANHDYIMSLDMDAEKRKYDDLDSRIKRAEQLTKDISDADTLAQVDPDLLYVGHLSSNERSQYEAELEEVLGGSTLQELKQQRDEQGRNNAYNERYQQQQRMRDDALNAVDFYQYAGVADTNDTQYKWINDVDGYRDSYETTQYMGLFGDSGYSGTNAFADKNLDQLSDDEKNAYNYYYNKYGKDKAQEFLDSLEDTLNRRAAGDIANTLDDSIALEYAFGVAAGLDQFKQGAIGAARAITGDDSYHATSTTQYASQLIGEDLLDVGRINDEYSLGKAGYDLITTTANMAPSILASAALSATGIPALAALAKVASPVMIGATAGGNAYTEMVNLGYSRDQAGAYSALTGASEALLEKLLSGVTTVGGLLPEASAVLAKRIDKALFRAAVEFGADILGEGVEEYLQDILEPWFQNIALGTANDVPLYTTEALYSGILGALSAAGINGIDAKIQKTADTQLGKRLNAQGITGSRLAEIGHLYSADSVAYKLADKITDNSKPSQIGKLFREMNATFTEQNISDISNWLTENTGMPSSDAKTLANALNSLASGDGLTARQVKLLDRNKAIADAVIEEIIEPNTTEYHRRLASMSGLMEDISRAEASKEGGKSDTKVDEKTPFVANDHGEAAFNTAEGAVEISDSILNNADAMVAGAIEKIGASVDEANQIWADSKSIRESRDSVAIRQYVEGIIGAYNTGRIGSDGRATSRAIRKLTTSTYNAVSNAATRSANAETEIAQQKVNALKQTNNKRGNLFYTTDVSKKTLSDSQYTAVNAMKILSKVFGIDFIVYASEERNGRRVYRNSEGNIVSAPNGFFDRATSTIGIDINAGQNGQGIAAYTLSHELTHFIKKWSPAKFKVLADFLVSQYDSKGTNVDRLVRLQQAKAAAKGRTISYDTAFEEFVADSMQTMLTDGEALKKIQQLRATDSELFNKLRNKIFNLTRAMKKAYKELDPEGDEAKAVKEMVDSFDKMSDLFAEALNDAGEAYKSSARNRGAWETYKRLQGDRDILHHERYVNQHMTDLDKYYSSAADVDLDTLKARYEKVIDIWKTIGGKLNSKFLNDWNNQDVKSRAFTVFKAQQGYKYNAELSSMCKKGIPLFEAIDTIVKKEVMNQLNTKTIGKAEKEILYDLLKSHKFEIPCAICYVEQARQREGAIITAFIDGKIDKDSKGKTTKTKLGWNQVLNDVEHRMKDMGVSYKFQNVSRDIATDKYTPASITMDETTQKAFYKALMDSCNAEIERYNKEDAPKNKKSLLKDSTPQEVKRVLKGNLPGNLGIYKVLFNNPDSRFRMSTDLLYSSMTTRNLATAHKNLYTLFNSQGGVSGYKTKQGTVAYIGDFLNKKWSPASTRKEGGIRNQSNSDFMMYTLLDQVQMYVDLSAKGYYLQAYTKVLAELKLFGKSGAKINASLIPSVHVFYDSNNNVDWEKTRENAGLDANGNLIFDDIEGINHNEAFMLLEDTEYSKNIGGICIGYSDNHIRKLLDDSRIQQIIGYHDKTDDPNKRYRGARYAKNYNGLNEAVRLKKDGTTETVHVRFNEFVAQAEKMFQKDRAGNFAGTAEFNGETYTADDIPKLAADLYLDKYSAKNGYLPAYNIPGIVDHPNYYKLLADFGLKNSEGKYAPHSKVNFKMPSSVPYLDRNGNKQMMPTSDYIYSELSKEMKVRDDIAEALADNSEYGIIPQFVQRVNELNKPVKRIMISSDADADGDAMLLSDRVNSDMIHNLNTGETVNTLEYLNSLTDEDVFYTYKSMTFWGYDKNGNAILRSPMAESVNGELSAPYLMPNDGSKIWYYATEGAPGKYGYPQGMKVKIGDSYKDANSDAYHSYVADDWSNCYFELEKEDEFTGKKSKVPARYNPYEHSSDVVLNDQFSSAYKRGKLVTVKMAVPKSEEGAYKAMYAKDGTGWTEWKSGIVAGKIAQQKEGFSRNVYLSRFAAPVEILDETTVAKEYQRYLDGTDVAVPDNVVPPKLLAALKKLGVNIDITGLVDEMNAKTPAEKARAEAIKNSYAAWKDATSAADDALEELGKKGRAYDRAESAVEKAADKLDKAKTADAKAKRKAELTAREQKLVSAKSALDAARSAYDSANANAKDARSTYNDALSGIENAVLRSERIVDQMKRSMTRIMEVDSVASIDANNASPFLRSRKENAMAGAAVFLMQGGKAFREGYGEVNLTVKGARETVFHGNGPAKQATFPAIKAVIERGIEIGRDYNHNGKGFDTVTFSAPIDFFGIKEALGVVVKEYNSAVGEKNIYIHEICDENGNYISFDNGIVAVKEKAAPAKSNPKLTAGAADGENISEDIVQNPTDSVKQELRQERFASDANLSNRQILASAMMSAAKNDIERKRLEAYKSKAEDISSIESELREVKAQIKKMSFAKGKRDTAALTELKSRANGLQNRLNIADKQLLRIEAAAPIQNILERERVSAMKKSEAAKDAAVKAQREMDYQTFKAQVEAIQAKNRADIDQLRIARDAKVKAQREHDREVAERKTARQNASSLRKDIKSIMQSLDKRMMHPVEGKYVPKSMKSAVAEVLASIDRTSGREGNVTDKLNRLNSAYRELAKDRGEGQYIFDDTVSEMLNTIATYDVPLRDMDITQLTNVKNALTALDHAVKSAVKLESFKIKGIKTDLSVYQYAKKLIQETDSIDKAIGKVGKFVLTQLRPETALRWFGGYAKDSAWQGIYDSLNDAQHKSMDIQMKLGSLFNEITTSPEAATLFNTKSLVDVGLRDADGQPVLISRGMMLSLYMHLQNEQNARHVMEGGLTIPDVKAYYKGDLDRAYGSKQKQVVGISQGIAGIREDIYQIQQKIEIAQAANADSEYIADLEQQIVELEQQIEDMREKGNIYVDNIRAKIEGMLTKYERSIIAATQQLYSDSQKYLNDATMLMYGFDKATVANYFPIITDKAFLGTQFDSVSANFNLENAGFMKERQNGANPILLSDIIDTNEKQIRRTSQYAAYTPVLKDFNKVFGKSEAGFTNSVQKALEHKFDSAARTFIENLMADINGAGSAKEIVGFNALLSKVRGNMAGSTLSVNPRVALSQAASLPTASAELGADAIAHAVGKTFSKADLDTIAKYSPLLWYRIKGNSTTELGDMQKATHLTGKVDKYTKRATGWINAVDKWTVERLWFGSEYWVEKNTNYKRGTEEFYKAVAEKFNATVEHTQPNYTVMQRSDLLRSKSELTKLFTMFMTQRSQNFNIIADAVLDYQFTRKQLARGEVSRDSMDASTKKLASAISSQIAAAGTYVAVRVAVDALMKTMNAYRDDEDGDITVESMSREILNQLLSTLAGTVWLGSELYTAVYAAITGKKYYEISMPGVSQISEALSDFVTAAQKLLNADATAEAKKKAVFNVAKSVATGFGIPLNNCIKIFNAVMNNAADLKNGTFAEAGYDRTKKQNQNLWYKAVMAGDTKMAKEVYDSMLKANKESGEGKSDIAAEKATVSDMATALKNNDPRIVEAAEARYNRNYSAYKSIVDKIVADGFDRQAVISAVESAYNKLDESEKEENPSKEKGYFNHEDYFNAAVDGNSYASNIGDELVKNYVSNGKSEEEAQKTVKSNLKTDVKNALRSSEIGDSDAAMVLEKYCDMSAEEAEQQVDYWNFVEDKSAEDWNLSRYSKYTSTAEPAGISEDVYLGFLQTVNDTKADKDEDGKTINGSKKEKVLAYIDKLPLTDDQKDILYIDAGYAEKDIDSAPWH